MEQFNAITDVPVIDFIKQYWELYEKLILLPKHIVCGRVGSEYFECTRVLTTEYFESTQVQV